MVRKIKRNINYKSASFCLVLHDTRLGQYMVDTGKVSTDAYSGSNWIDLDQNLHFMTGSILTNIRIKAKWHEVFWVPWCVNGGLGS